MEAAIISRREAILGVTATLLMPSAGIARAAPAPRAILLFDDEAGQQDAARRHMEAGGLVQRNGVWVHSCPQGTIIEEICVQYDVVDFIRLNAADAVWLSCHPLDNDFLARMIESGKPDAVVAIYA